MYKTPGKLLLLLIATHIFLSACNKENFIQSSNATLTLSADTIKFDTVFTTAGSITQSVKIFNTNTQPLRISEIKLMGGNNSAYHMNVNGIANTTVNDYELAANDSMYIFVTVDINPNNQNQPFLINDSISIAWNGNTRFIQLEAYGQNAHYLNRHTISQHETWINDLPYVILGELTVEAGATLNISAGCRIFCHADAPILVNGTIQVNGEKNNEVVFRGDRLDTYYRDLPASWPGIYLLPGSGGHQFRFANILNAYQALVVSETSNATTIEQSIIHNSYKEGLLAKKSELNVSNSLISNCGGGVALMAGGNYQFTHCTMVTYANAYTSHNTPTLSISNYEIDNGNISSYDLSAIFVNCICWGEGSTDTEIETRKEGNTLYAVEWKNCLFKAATDPANALYTDVIRNEDPQFDSIDISHQYYDFRTTRNSFAPGIDRGVVTPFPKDLDDNPRVVATFPDLGCYERQ